jgi:hypothetical protein
MGTNLTEVPDRLVDRLSFDGREEVPFAGTESDIALLQVPVRRIM